MINFIIKLKKIVLTPTHSRAAFSLVSVMMSVGVFGIVAAAATKMIGNSMKAQKHINLKSDKQSIKRTLLVRTNCQTSFVPASTCPSASPVALFSSDGSVLVKRSGTPTRFGGFAVRAECNATNDGLIVRATRLRQGATIVTNNAADFLPDPLTKRVSLWSSNESLLFPSGAILCPNSQSTNQLIDVTTTYKPPVDAVSSVQVNVPNGTRTVRINGKGNYVCTGCNWDGSDDTELMYIIVDLNGMTSTGLHTSNQGIGLSAYVANYSWNKLPLPTVLTAANTTGDFDVGASHAGQTNHPSISYNAGLNNLTIGNLDTGFNFGAAHLNEQISFVFEFYR